MKKSRREIRIKQVLYFTGRARATGSADKEESRAVKDCHQRETRKWGTEGGG